MAAWRGSSRGTGQGRKVYVAEIVNAAVAIILREDGKVLLGQRPEGKPWAGWWEFPGGKIESGEALEDALQRELHEEIGIEATEFYPWLTRTFAYPERTVRLHFFTVRRWLGEPHGKENQQLSWQHPASVELSPLLPANEPILSALQLPPVYAITHLEKMGEALFIARLEHALKNGLKLIQVREKELAEAKLEKLAAKIVHRAHHYGARVLINGNEELARRIGTDGVHLPANMLMACNSRPTDMMCGSSCHNEQELEHAAKLGLDFVLLSPVHATQSHPDTPPLGWQKFTNLIAGYPLPVFALGGMLMGNLTTAWMHGAHGIAMQRAVWQ